MLQTDAFYPYAVFDTTESVKQYKIVPGDQIDFRVLANNGSSIISLGGQGNQQNNGYSSRVESDGFIKLPAIGRVYIQGLTYRQAELFLEEKYSEFLNSPFVNLNITNKRIFLFIGGTASVVPLRYENTTLLEVLASNGGVPLNAKAGRIKIIRGDLKNPKVYIVNLSELKNVENDDLVMQGNDIVYIETRREYVNRTLELLTPYMTLVSTIVLTFTLIRTFR